MMDDRERLAATEEALAQCDRENSNLRKHLLWAATQLPPDSFKELKARIDKPFEEDGVIVGEEDSERDAQIKLRSAANRLCDLADEIADSPRSSQEVMDIYAVRLSAAANVLRGIIGPEPEHTLHSFLEEGPVVLEMIDVTGVIG